MVVIGRNEGARLCQCLDSVGWTHRIVYADSASSDGSPDQARERDLEVVSLTAERPFTAARGRAEGLQRLLQCWPDTDFVLFVDGDCVVQDEWLSPALGMLEQQADLAVVCGLRREAFPQASVNNRIMDMEWDAPIGQVDSCGGDALMKAALVTEVGGFNPSVLAGEEPELCFRLRKHGYRVERIAEPMSLHDARMTKLRQWCRREIRSGFGAWDVWNRCGRSANSPFSILVRSAFFWGLILPTVALAVILGLAVFHIPSAIAVTTGLFAVYLLQWFRISRHGRRRGLCAGDARVYGAITMIAKFCQAIGMVQAGIRRQKSPIGNGVEKNSLQINGAPDAS